MTIDKLRQILVAAGAPLTLEQIMEQMPDGTDRAAVSALCRQRKAIGELVASVEDGKVAYALAPENGAAKPAAAPAPTPAAAPADKPAGNNVHPMYGRRATDMPGAKSGSLTDQIRALLLAANEPLTVAQITAALPEANPTSIQSLLHQRKKAGEFGAVEAGGNAHGYFIAPGRVGRGAAVAIAVSHAPPAAGHGTPAAAPAPAPAHAPEKPPAPGTAISVFDEAFTAAEKALDLYVASVLPNPEVYFALKASAAAARAARDASKEPRDEP